MSNIDKDQVLAEEMRLIYRHLHWAAGHAANVYNLIKPEEKPALEVDKNQLSLFSETETNDE